MYKSHKLIFYSQENIDNISNVESETFWNVMPNIGSFWISWELHIPKKLGQVAIRGRKS